MTPLQHSFQLFAILFFFMLFVLGVGSLVALHGTANTVVQDIFPKLAGWKVSACTATAGFLIGLMYVTPVSPIPAETYLDNDATF